MIYARVSQQYWNICRSRNSEEFNLYIPCSRSALSKISRIRATCIIRHHRGRARKSGATTEIIRGRSLHFGRVPSRYFVLGRHDVYLSTYVHTYNVATRRGANKRKMTGAAPGHIGVKLENVCQYAGARHLSSSPLGIHARRRSSPLSSPRNFGAVPATDTEWQEMWKKGEGGEETLAEHDRYSFFFLAIPAGIHKVAWKTMYPFELDRGINVSNSR